jgi:hypothetical protein
MDQFTAERYAQGLCIGTYRAAAPKFSFLSAGSRYLEFVVTSIDTIYGSINLLQYRLILLGPIAEERYCLRKLCADWR